MKISEYINSEKEKMKGKPLKERLAYFWEYYKWYVIIAVVAVLLLTQTIVNIANTKESVMEGLLLDGTAPLDAPAIVYDFYAQEGIDPDKQEAVFNTGFSLDSSMPEVVSNTYQTIFARVGAEDLDFIMGYEYAIQRLAYGSGGMFADLRDVFSPETLASMEGCLYYIDGAVANYIDENPMEEIPLPDPFHPEAMEDPIPVAVDITACKEFSSVYYSPDKNVYISVVVNAPHKDLAVRYISFLFSRPSVNQDETN